MVVLDKFIKMFTDVPPNHMMAIIFVALGLAYVLSTPANDEES